MTVSDKPETFACFCQTQMACNQLCYRDSLGSCQIQGSLVITGTTTVEELLVEGGAQFKGTTFFDGLLCDDNVTSGVCDSGGTFWNIGGNGLVQTTGQLT